MGLLAYIHPDGEDQNKSASQPLKTVISEAELLQGCREGNRLMQEKLYQHFYGKMLPVCLRYTHDRDTALDIMNRGFLRVFQKIHSYQATGSLEGWIRVIIVHAVTDYFRYEKKRPVELPENLPETGEAPTGLSAGELRKVLYQLPEKQRLVFTLFAVDGYLHREIARMLDMNENTVRWTYTEAKKKLQELLHHLL
jgi:RNA polymerase sigma factor (sigma-70 family)